MPVAIEMQFTGATLEQYEGILEKMGLTAGGSTPPGAIFHWAAQTDDGLKVVDVWETKEQWERFAEEQVRPVSEQVGFPEPEIRYIDVHNYMVGG